MSWEIDNKRPVYIQLKEEIKRRIITGIYGPGCKMPSVRDLAFEASVNPNTMQRALSDLENEGFIITQRTSGRTVTDDEGMLHEARKNLARKQVQEFLEKMEAIGFSKEEIVGLLGNEVDDNGHTA